MGLVINGTTINPTNDVYVNGVAVNNVYINNVLVWSKSAGTPEIIIASNTQIYNPADEYELGYGLYYGETTKNWSLSQYSNIKKIIIEAVNTEYPTGNNFIYSTVEFPLIELAGDRSASQQEYVENVSGYSGYLNYYLSANYNSSTKNLQVVCDFERMTEDYAGINVMCVTIVNIKIEV